MIHRFDLDCYRIITLRLFLGGIFINSVMTSWCMSLAQIDPSKRPLPLVVWESKQIITFSWTHTWIFVYFGSVSFEEVLIGVVANAITVPNVIDLQWYFWHAWGKMRRTPWRLINREDLYKGAVMGYQYGGGPWIIGGINACSLSQPQRCQASGPPCWCQLELWHPVTRGVTKG